jgi:hypothetical protein
MKASYDTAKNRPRHFTAQDMSRRELLKAGVGFAAAVSGLDLVSGCAKTEAPINRIVPLKGKPDNKIYPSKEGCFVGFYKQQNWDRRILGRGVSTTIDHYRNAFGANPAIIAFWSFLSLGFPVAEAKTMKENGIMPYISIMPGREKWRPSFDPDDIVQGKCDSYIKRLATDAALFGEEQGGFFFTTMVEPNADWWPWSRKPNTTHAVRRVWQIFEDQGANRYATWVWEAFCPARYGYHVDDPELYFPGDKYVDWIGFNVFANLKNQYISETTMFSDLMSKTYEEMLRNHPEKSMMVSEFGRTPGPNQPSWLVDAFQSMKKNFPPIKAAIYYDNITGVLTGQDHTLDQTSLKTLKEVFEDSYWIMERRST